MVYCYIPPFFRFFLVPVGRPSRFSPPKKGAKFFWGAIHHFLGSPTMVYGVWCYIPPFFEGTYHGIKPGSSPPCKKGKIKSSESRIQSYARYNTNTIQYINNTIQSQYYAIQSNTNTIQTQYNTNTIQKNTNNTPVRPVLLSVPESITGRTALLLPSRYLLAPN